MIDLFNGRSISGSLYCKCGEDEYSPVEKIMDELNIVPDEKDCHCQMFQQQELKPGDQMIVHLSGMLRESDRKRMETELSKQWGCPVTVLNKIVSHITILGGSNDGAI